MIGFEFVDIECKHFSTVVIYVAKKIDGAFSAKVLERLILLPPRSTLDLGIDFCVK